MRLVSLELAGFGAFREPASFDFSDSDFFALAGPTGAGKSTVIDGVCFALYGSVPRYDNANLVRYVISLGAAEARVSLRFTLDGAAYCAARVVRRTKNQFATKEARLERLAADGKTDEILAGRAGEMGPAVEGLLHLSFEDFTRCVALPQGEFAEFLRAKGEDRRDLLVRLLNFGVYERVGQRAGSVAEAARAEADRCRNRLEALAEATPAALKEARRRLRSISTLASKAETLRPQVDGSLGVAADLERRAAETEQLAGLLARIEVPAEALTHGEEMRRAAGAVTAAEALVEETRRARLQALEAIDGLPAERVLENAVRDHQNLAEAVSDCAAGAKSVAEAERAATEAARRLALAEQEAAAAATAIQAARAAHSAAALAGSLVAGQPCPVCLIVVRSLPDHVTPPDLEAAEAACREAEGALPGLREAASAVKEALSAAKTKLERFEKDRQNLAAAVAEHPDAGAARQLLETVRARNAALAEARAAEDRAGDALVEARAAQDALAVGTARLQAALTALRDPVAALGPPEPRHVDLLGDWQALAGWAGPARAAQQEAARTATTGAAAERKKIAGLVGSLVSEAAALGLALEVAHDGVEALVPLMTLLAAEQARAEQAVAGLEEAIAERGIVEAERRQFEEQASVAAELRRHLKADRFPEWLIAEALELLVEDASRTLRELTGGAYSLALGDKEFLVVDHDNADERRPARTLSGGETFQASLALALALSDQIRGLAAEGAPQLDSLFLDEGFGTLDPETLEVVAATIENLGQRGRMVGIVSHVRELAARVPVRFEIRKGTRTSTVEKVYT